MNNRNNLYRRPFLEQLEDRAVPTAGIQLLANSFNVPEGRTELIPLSLVTPPSASASVFYSAQSSTSQVTTQVLTTSQTWELTVTGKDANGNTFNGNIEIALFPTESPVAVGRIIQLTNDGYYTGQSFYRVLSGFVAQGGNPNSDGPLPNFNDEFYSDLSFNSPGLAAFANAGPDTNSSQFFITDISQPLSGEPQNLNYRYDMFGQLVSGFSTFASLMSTPVGPNSSGEDSAPLTPVTITKAQIINDPTTAILRINSAAGFTGNATINVSADDGSGPSTASFGVDYITNNVDANGNAIINPPYLNPVANETTYANTPVSFQIPAADVESNQQLTYTVTDPNNFGGTPANVTVSVNQATGVATVTPVNGFTGVVSLMVGVRDQNARNGQPLSAQSQYDTHVITLDVLANTGGQQPIVNPINLPYVAGGSNVLDGTPLTFTAYAEAPVTGGSAPSLTYSLASGAPTGASINAQTGQVTWTPSNANDQTPGAYTLTVIATETNNALLSGVQTFNVAVGQTSVVQGSGIAARTTVANGIAFSAEYFSDFVTAAYIKYLGRSPESSGLAYWVAQLQQGLTDEKLEAGFIGSAEYIANHGGTGQNWIIGMYQNLLGRTPAPSEVQYWLTQLNNGEAPSAVALGFAASQEREADRVQADYQQYLGRSASATEVAFWVNSFLSGTRNEQVVAGFVASQEYFQNSGDNVVDWVYASYRAILQREPDTNGLAYWLTKL